MNEVYTVETVNTVAVQKPHKTILVTGNRIYIIAEGRLVNLAAGDGHPAEIMDMSFGIQAKGLEYLAKHGKEMDNRVYAVPAEIDRTVALIKLNANNVHIDTLSPEQEAYLDKVE